jgi:hypothetical protein
MSTMLATQDPKHRSVVAQLIGWKLPMEKRDG